MVEALDTQVATKTSIQEVRTNALEAKSEKRFVRWMVGFNFVFTCAILWKVFS